MKTLELEKMSKIEGGRSAPKDYWAFACGAGIALSIGTGGLGAVVWGPATVGACYAFING
jgi:hypothetical protein